MSTKLPSTQDMTFGVELETLRPQGVEGRIGAYHNGIAVPWAPNTNTGTGRKKWKAERDGSINPRQTGMVGCEYVSPIMKGEKGFSNLIAFMAKLRELLHKVNSSCGGHIHIGLRSIVGDANADEVVAFLTTVNMLVLNWQDALFAQTGTRRGEMTYSARQRPDENMTVRIKEISEKPKGDKTMEDYNTIRYSSARYRPVNLTNIRNGAGNGQATLEFRFPAGTLNPNKMLMHIFTCMFICRLAWKIRHTKRDACNWELNKGYHRKPAKAGVLGLKFLLRRMTKSKAGRQMLDESATFADRWERMEAKANEMAVKYDNNYRA